MKCLDERESAPQPDKFGQHYSMTASEGEEDEEENADMTLKDAWGRHAETKGGDVRSVEEVGRLELLCIAFCRSHGYWRYRYSISHVDHCTRLGIQMRHPWAQSMLNILSTTRDFWLSRYSR